MKLALFIGLAVFALGYIAVWVRALSRARRRDPEGSHPGGSDHQMFPTPAQASIGFVTNFFDTLGIGSFAPTASVYKLTRMVPDALIPGTMNVGHTLPVVVMAYIYITIVEVDPRTLAILIGSSVFGAWLGADLVSRLPRQPIQIGIGIALIIAGALMAFSQLGFIPVGGETLGLDGKLLIAAALGNFALGALNTIGVGLYGPCMIMIALLGMNPKAAFPIMMGSCAFLMPVGSARFVRNQAYSPRPALGLTLGGIPAVLIAAFIVQSLALDTLRWLVVVVAAYTAVMMLRSAAKGEPSDASQSVESPDEESK